MTTRGKSGGRRGFLAPAATAIVAIMLVMALGGVTATVLFAGRNTSPPASAPETTNTPSPTTAETRSPATRLVIPTIDVKTRLVRLGTAKTNTIELPPPDRAGWYKAAAAPGQEGVCILAGYIQRSAEQPGVFLNLRRLAKGDVIRVERADGKVASYDVTSIATYAAGKFPTQQFYASTGEPLLRIVTTGGRLRPKAPQGNVVIEAELVDVR